MNRLPGMQGFSDAGYADYWARFDALPRPVRAALWDSLRSWDHDRLVPLVAQFGVADAVNAVLHWDRVRLARDPGVAADVPMLRAFLPLYEVFRDRSMGALP